MNCAEKLQYDTFHFGSDSQDGEMRDYIIPSRPHFPLQSRVW